MYCIENTVQWLVNTVVIIILVCNQCSKQSPLIILLAYVDSWHSLNGFTKITVKKSAWHDTKGIIWNHCFSKLQLVPNCRLFFDWGTKLQRGIYYLLLTVLVYCHVMHALQAFLFFRLTIRIALSLDYSINLLTKFKAEAISPPTQNQQISKSNVYLCCTIKYNPRGGILW